MAPHHYPLPVLQHPRRNHYAPMSIKIAWSASELATNKPHPRRTDVRLRAQSAKPIRFVRSKTIFLSHGTKSIKLFGTQMNLLRTWIFAMVYLAVKYTECFVRKYEIICFFRAAHDPYCALHRALPHRHACRRAFYPCTHRALVSRESL